MLAAPRHEDPRMWTRVWLVVLWIAPAIPARADDPPENSARSAQRSSPSAPKPARANRRRELVAHGIPVDDPAPKPKKVVIPPRSGHSLDGDVPPGSPPEGLWTWVSRLEGPKALHEVTRELQAPRPQPGPIPQVVTPPAPGQPVALHLDRIDPTSFDIPVVVNADVQRWMTYFLGNGRKHFQRYLDRSGLVEPMMRQELRTAGMPEDLIYLALIESGYNFHAYSEAGAAGLWQFMPGTGRMYDLRVDTWVDDRRDPFKSTRAAVAHLRDLHIMFEGDWLLAWSAYNAGPGRVRKAIAAGGTRDFWQLVARGHLPAETANYAPKLMAAAILGHQPALYGFRVLDPAPLQVEVVRVEGSVEVEVLAACAGLSLAEMQALNPGLRRSATPPEGYDLNIPHGRFPAFLAALEAIPVHERPTEGHHTVKKGETLGRIAQQHGVPVGDLVRANRLASADKISVGQKLVIPRPGEVPPSSRPPVAGAPARSVRTVYAETPESRIPNPNLASRPAPPRVVSTADPAPPPPEPATSSAPTPVLAEAPAPAATPVAATPVAAAPSTTYKVKPGDTLSEIAARHRVSLHELLSWNRIASPSQIQVGQVIRLDPTGAPEAAYRVRSGDSLGAIAQAHGCSVAELRAWNKLGSDVIHPGQVLRVSPTR
jgi:membrane-bound lytic murein transglycosylase D